MRNLKEIIYRGVTYASIGNKPYIIKHKNDKILWTKLPETDDHYNAVKEMLEAIA